MKCQKCYEWKVHSCWSSFAVRLFHFRFIVNIEYAFEDKENLYLVMDLMLGGDLRYHICKQKRFTESQTSNFLFLIFRNLCGLHSFSTWIHPQMKNHSLRPETWKFSTWLKRFCVIDWFWHCLSAYGWQFLRHLGNSRIYGSWSNVSLKSFYWSWLFCVRCHCIWVHVW